MCDCLDPYLITVASPNACLEASAMHLMHLTSFPCPASHRWRLATRSIPLRSVFFPIRTVWSLPFLSRHVPQSFPPDRMALELRAWKCTRYTTLRTILTQSLGNSTNSSKVWFNFNIMKEMSSFTFLKVVWLCIFTDCWLNTSIFA